LIDKFGDEVSDKKVYGTPGTPGTPRFKVSCPDEDSKVIDNNLQKNYCSGVGMLLYLIKYSRPDLSNAVRELSKCIDKATNGTYHEMLRVIKFVLDTKILCLQIKPKFDNKNSWIHDNVEDVIIKIEFVISFGSDSDIFTKNVNHETYEKHAMKFLGSIEDFRDE